MSLLGAFIAHEARLQLRSTRFRAFAIVYAAMAAAPAVVLHVASREVGYVIDTAAYAHALRAVSGAATALFATMLAVDAITRERDEGSFGVVSLAPMSASGYVVRRWLALVALALPITLLPIAIAAALSMRSAGRLPALAPLGWEWLLHVAPPLLAVSALMLALGTITGRTILAVLTAGGALTFGVGFLQDILAWSHRHLDGPGSVIGLDAYTLTRLMWMLRGFWQFDAPTAAGYPIETELDRLLPEGALLLALTLLAFGWSPAFLRRTRADLRPWRIRDDHPLRTILRGINRVRENFHPDAAPQAIDRVLRIAAVLAAIGCLAFLLRRESRFMQLASERYAADSAAEPREMSATLVPIAIRVDGEIGRALRTRTTVAIENRGTHAEQHLAFSLHPGLRLGQTAATCGRTRVMRRWERLGIDIQPPLAPGARCDVTIDVAGNADAIVFSLTAFAGRFGTRYRRWREATESRDLSDLSRSTFIPAVTRARLRMTAADFAPVPRYTPWRVDSELMDPSRDTSSFIRERVLPVSDVRLSLRLPDGITAADSCGTFARRRIESRCAFSFAELRITGAHFTTVPLGGHATLLHLPVHDELARIHAPAIAEALSIAERAWPGLQLHAAPLFVERPAEPGERVGYFNARNYSELAASGPVYFIPESTFVRRKALDAPAIAASIIQSSLSGRRPLVADERPFFDALFDELASSRTGAGGQRSAVISSFLARPSAVPLLAFDGGGAATHRLRGVLVDLEYRVGADRIIESVNEFGAKSGAGSAEELLRIIAAHANVSLDQFYRDYFTGSALPKLTLEDALFRRDGGRWIVTGVAHNIGTGEVLCPLVLRTQFGSVRQTVRIGANERVAFTLGTEHTPRTLQLDPDHVVYRVAAIGLVDSIDFRGES